MNQTLTNYEIEYDQFCFSYCTKSLCFDIKKKMRAIRKFYNLVKNININDDNKEKRCGD